MTQKLVDVPKLGDPSPYVCHQCDHTFPNKTPDDQSKIQRHLILHVPDSTRRWSLMDAWLAEQNQRNESTNPSP
jgi:hypothetical protein